MTNKVKLGLRRQKLIIISPNISFYLEKSGKKRWQSEVVCDCGDEFIINNNYFMREKNNQCLICRYNTNCIVSIGQIFDKLTVIGYDNNDRRKKCLCKCICGNTVSIRPECLASNKQNNCGCILRYGIYVGKIAATIFSNIKSNARARDLPFEIDIRYLSKLYEDQGGKCALTGLPIEFGKKVADKRTASIDRIDPNYGYILGNLQWVHKDINTIKWNLSQENFIKNCKLVAGYYENKK